MYTEQPITYVYFADSPILAFNQTRRKSWLHPLIILNSDVD